MKSSKIAFVALEGKKIVGVVDGGIKNGDCYTRWLYVDKKHHGKGIARKLMEKIENRFRKKSKIAKVSSSVFAVGFYQKVGYKKTRGIVKKRGWKYYPMQKKL